MKSIMLDRLRRFAALLVIATVGTLTVRAADNLTTAAEETIHNFIQKDPTLEQVLERSAGYAVFPNAGQGGFIIGGARGTGLLYENGKPIGEATMTKATIGAQVGGQSFSELIIFQTPEALRDFKSSNFELAANASGVLATSGAAKSASYEHGVAVFTIPKSGAMVQAAVGGQKFKFYPYK